MKKLLFIVALFTSVLLISCSESVTEPVGGNTTKSFDVLYEYPYEYLQGFEEVKVLDWNLPGTSDDRDISLRIDRNIEDVEDIFVMVNYGDPLVDTEGHYVLYFIDQPGEDIMKLHLDMDLPVKDVKAFVLNRTSSVETESPYMDAYRFRGVTSTWEIRDDNLVISALPWTPDVLEVYAHISREGQDELIYLQLPHDSGRMMIPIEDVDGITGVHLFVNSLVSLD
jgi:hypothetical protein